MSRTEAGHTIAVLQAIIFPGAISFKIRICIFQLINGSIWFPYVFIPFTGASMGLVWSKGMLVFAKFRGMVWICLDHDHSPIPLPSDPETAILQPSTPRDPPQPVLTNVTLCDEERAAQQEAVPKSRKKLDVSKA